MLPLARSPTWRNGRFLYETAENISLVQYQGRIFVSDGNQASQTSTGEFLFKRLRRMRRQMQRQMPPEAQNALFTVEEERA